MTQLTWTADPPTVPGDYLYHYRFSGGLWQKGLMRIGQDDIPVKPDTSETLWFGPIPEPVEPAREGGEG